MKSISLQFHAAPEELELFVCSWVDAHQLFVTAITFPPFCAKEVERIEIVNVLKRDDVNRLIFTLSHPILPANSVNHFLDQNPDALVLDLSRLVEHSLSESWLTTKHVNPTWLKIAKELKNNTRTGVIAVNPTTGEAAELRNHRFTEGAQLLAENGIVMRPVAGSSILKFV